MRFRAQERRRVPPMSLKSAIWLIYTTKAVAQPHPHREVMVGMTQRA